MKKKNTKPSTKKLINEIERTEETIWDHKNPVEEALKKSSDEVLAEAIRDLLNKDLPN